MLITRANFIKATGRKPEQDDLERCNCKLAGEIGHLCCGWNTLFNCPQFEVGPNFKRSPAGQASR